MTARVSWIALTPVKATMLHLVDEVDLLESGVRGDRRFYFVTERGRLVNNKDHGPLQLVRAEYDEAADELSLRLAGGEVLAGQVERGEEVETTFHKRPRSARVVRRALGRRRVGRARSARAPRRARAAGARPWPRRARRRCSRPRRSAGSPHSSASTRLDHRRFRMNFGVEGVEAHAEDAWRGRRVRIGNAVVIPQGHVGRCVITTQNPDTGGIDLDTLKGLAAYRGDAATTEPLPFGIHAAVAEAGPVRVGDPVELI